MPAFVDTNVLIYAIVGEAHERRKRDIARDLLRGDDRVLSYQVLAEFCHQATRKGRSGALTLERASQYVRAFSRFPIVPGTTELVMEGLQLRRSTNYSMWDCMIIAAAKAGGCDTLLSEDMDDGRTVHDVTIVNPFAETA
jgi:predicted nucleic acid-binding protein